VSSIAETVRSLAFEAGRYIIREGETGEDFFIIKAGIVCITRAVPSK
jgi:CRP-like cAMP-binding protein